MTTVHYYYLYVVVIVSPVLGVRSFDGPFTFFSFYIYHKVFIVTLTDGHGIIMNACHFRVGHNEEQQWTLASLGGKGRRANCVCVCENSIAFDDNASAASHCP
jgi:hypothetical protein